jgi:histidinol-phosphate phosphatase family protein
MSRYHDWQELILTAERSARDGKIWEAHVAFKKAGELQCDMVKALPAQKIRTRTVFANSAAVLFERAGEWEEADDILEFARVENRQFHDRTYGDKTVIIVDLDATLRRCTVRDQACPHKLGEWELLPWIGPRLSCIDWSTVAFGVATNQADVARGHLSEAMAHQLAYDAAMQALGWNAWMTLTTAGMGPHIRICPHDPNEGCACRKPKPGMLTSIMDKANALPHQALYVGDLDSDRQAAEFARCGFAWAWDFCGVPKDEWVGWLAKRAEDGSRSVWEQLDLDSSSPV